MNQMENHENTAKIIGPETPVHIIKEMVNDAKDHFVFSPQEYIPGPDTKKQTIFLKIANIMGGLDRVPKTGYNKAHDYHYVTESDVVGAVRPLMAKEKLIMMPSIKSYKAEDIPTKYSKLYLGTIEIEWILRDAESYEQVKFTMIGKGTDTLEKDIYKAISGNKKYALISIFLIDSGDDPERNDTPNEQRPLDNAQNGQNGGQNQSKQQNKGNTSRQQTNSTQGQNKPSENPPKVDQPTKGDLITRWVILAGTNSGKTKTEIRQDFDEWYKKKSENDKWDHFTMMTALTKSLHKMKQAEKDAEDAKKEGQASKEKADEPKEGKPDPVGNADDLEKEVDQKHPTD